MNIKKVNNKIYYHKINPIFVLRPVKPRSFSWEQIKQEAVDIKIARAMTFANGNNPDFNIKHPDWVKQAQSNNFTDLKIKIKALVEKQQQQALTRRERLGRKS